jgi:ribosomal protein S25
MLMRYVEVYEVMEKIEINSIIKSIIRKYTKTEDITNVLYSKRGSLYAELTAIKREIELKYKIKG